MPLDVAVAPKTLTSTLHYLKRGTEKPASYRIEPPPGVPRWNGIDDPRDVTIEDARGRKAEFTLDRNGFALVKAPTAIADFYPPDHVPRRDRGVRSCHRRRSRLCPRPCRQGARAAGTRGRSGGTRVDGGGQFPRRRSVRAGSQPYRIFRLAFGGRRRSRPFRSVGPP